MFEHAPGVFELGQGGTEGPLLDWHAMWQPIPSAPFDRDLELAVIDQEGTHALVFPCRRILGGWIDAETKRRVDVRPTHWREWDSQR